MENSRDYVEDQFVREIKYFVEVKSAAGYPERLLGLHSALQFIPMIFGFFLGG